MDIPTLARSQARNRVAIGAGLVLAPSLFARVWVGGAAAEPARVIARSLGLRDLALGLGDVRALQDRDRARARRTFAAQAVAAAYARDPDV